MDLTSQIDGMYLTPPLRKGSSIQNTVYYNWIITAHHTWISTLELRLKYTSHKLDSVNCTISLLATDIID